MKNILACTLSLLLPAASLRAAGINTANSDPFNPDAVRVNEPGREYWLRPSAAF